MRSAAAAIVFLLAGCDGRAVERFELGDLDVEFGFLVVLDDQDRPTRTSEFFGISSDQKISFGELPSFELTKNERGAVLVALDIAGLSAFTGFDASRSAELRVVLEAPPESPEVEDPEENDPVRGVLRAAIPDSARFISVESEGHDRVLESTPAPDALAQAIRQSIRLSVPIDFEYCRLPGSAPKMRSLAGSPTSFREVDQGQDTAGSYFRHMERLDDGRIILISWSGIFLVRADAPFVMDGRHYLPFPMSGIAPSAFAIDPRPDPSGRKTILVTAGDPHLAQPPRGALRTYTLGDDDLQYVSSSTLSFPLGEVLIGGDGRVLIGLLSDTQLYERPAGADAFELMPLPGRGGDGGVSHLAATHDPELPYVATTHGRVHFYDSRSAMWGHEDIENPGVLRLERVRPMQVAIAPRGDDFEVYVGGQYGLIFQRSIRGEWSSFTIPLPPRGYACSKSADATGPGAIPGIEGLAVVDDHLLATLGQCSPLFVIDQSRTCSAVIPPEDGGVVREMSINLYNIDVKAHSIVVSGDHGVLEETTF